MKIGVSSYSFHQAVEAGTLSTYGIVDTAARMGFASIDFAVLLGGQIPWRRCARASAARRGTPGWTWPITRLPRTS